MSKERKTERGMLHFFESCTEIIDQVMKLFIAGLNSRLLAEERVQGTKYSSFSSAITDEYTHLTSEICNGMNVFADVAYWDAHDTVSMSNYLSYDQLMQEIQQNLCQKINISGVNGFLCTLSSEMHKDTSEISQLVEENVGVDNFPSEQDGESPKVHLEIVTIDDLSAQYSNTDYLQMFGMETNTQQPLQDPNQSSDGSNNINETSESWATHGMDGEIVKTWPSSQQNDAASNLAEDIIRAGKDEKNKDVASDYELDLCTHCNDELKTDRHVKKHRTNQLKSRVKCKECSKTFCTKQALSIHKVQHLKPFICKICSCRFRNRTSLQTHEHVHSGEAPYECSVCHKGFRSPPLLSDHMRCHKPKVSCPHCDVKFSKRANLLRHIETGHVGAVMDMKCKYTCTECYLSFRFLSTLKAHMVKTHPDSAEAQQARLKCKTCRLVFTSEAALDEHVMTCAHESVSCDICGKTFANRAVLNSHMRYHSEQHFSCPYCPKRFVKSYDLKSHVARLHENNRPMKCEFCFKGFVTRTELERHLVTHTGISKYKCSTCLKCFVSNIGLQRHITEIHMRIARHMCDQCGEGFRCRRDLQNHIARHNDNKPFKCKYCRKGFSWEQGLKRHVASHENAEQLKNKKPHQDATRLAPRILPNGSNIMRVLKSSDAVTTVAREDLISAEEVSVNECQEVELLVAGENVQEVMAANQNEVIYEQDNTTYKVILYS